MDCKQKDDFETAAKMLEKAAKLPTDEGIKVYIGNGFSYAAEDIKREASRSVILTFSEEELHALLEAGLEAYKADLSEDLFSKLSEVLDGKDVSAYICAGVFRYFSDPEYFLKTLRKTIKSSNSRLIFEAANITHRDIAAAVLSGEFDSSDEILKDIAGRGYINEKRLSGLMSSTGWAEESRDDIRREKLYEFSDSDNVLLQKDSAARLYLDWLKDTVDNNASTVRFIRTYIPAETDGTRLTAVPPVRPFLSVITRTQGKRIGALGEVFLCLSGQECRDFEVLVMGHKVLPEAAAEVEGLIASQPEWLRNRTRFIRVEYGSRTAPLTEGFAAAKGKYISILDDDDLVFANWVSEFYNLYHDHSGRILRTNCVRQDWTMLQTGKGTEIMRAVGSPEKIYTEEFDMIEQFYKNNCPTLTLAFPASAYHDLGLRFDEDLTTTEDWDFLMRNALICGVANSKEITSIYRWWVKGESSMTVVSPEGWEKNQNKIISKLDSMPVLLPEGSVSEIRYLSEIKDKYMRASHAFGRYSLYNAKTKLFYDVGEGFSGDSFLTAVNKKIGLDCQCVFNGLEQAGKIISLRWDPTEGRFIFIRHLNVVVKYSDKSTDTFSLADAEYTGKKIPGGVWFPRRDPNLTFTLGNTENKRIVSVDISGKWSKGYLRYIKNIFATYNVIGALKYKISQKKQRQS